MYYTLLNNLEISFNLNLFYIGYYEVAELSFPRVSSFLQLPSSSNTESEPKKEIVQCVAPEELNISFSAHCENNIETLLLSISNENSPQSTVSTATVAVQTTNDDLLVKNFSSVHIIAGAVTGILFTLLLVSIFIKVNNMNNINNI